MTIIKGLTAALLGYIFSVVALVYYFESLAGPCDKNNLNYGVFSGLASFIYAGWGLLLTVTVFVGLIHIKVKYPFIISTVLPLVIMFFAFGYAAWHTATLPQIHCE